VNPVRCSPGHEHCPTCTGTGQVPVPKDAQPYTPARLRALRVRMGRAYEYYTSPKRCGMPAAHLAWMLGISERAYHNYASGRRAVPYGVARTARLWEQHLDAAGIWRTSGGKLGRPLPPLPAFLDLKRTNVIEHARATRLRKARRAGAA